MANIADPNHLIWICTVCICDILLEKLYIVSYHQIFESDSLDIDFVPRAITLEILHHDPFLFSTLYNSTTFSYTPSTDLEDMAWPQI